MVTRIPSVLGLALCATLPLSAHADDTAVMKLAIQSQFDVRMSDKIANTCDHLTINGAGREAYFTSVSEILAGLGQTPDVVAVKYPASAFVGLYESYAIRHGVDVFGKISKFCKAADQEIANQSGIGVMLKGADT